jgi:hypothetical protein
MRLAPFKNDFGKMMRLEAYFLEEKGQYIVFDVPNNMMTGSQLRKEKEEFKKLIEMYRDWQQKNTQSKDQSNTVFSRDNKLPSVNNSADRQPKIKAFDWVPERLLLLRFGLPDPHQKRDKQSLNLSSQEARTQKSQDTRYGGRFTQSSVDQQSNEAKPTSRAAVDGDSFFLQV